MTPVRGSERYKRSKLPSMALPVITPYDLYAAAALEGINACVRDYDGGTSIGGRALLAHKHALALLGMRPEQ